MKITARNSKNFQKAEEMLASIQDAEFIKDVEAEYTDMGLFITKRNCGENIVIPETLRIADVDVVFPLGTSNAKQIKIQTRLISTSEWIYILFSLSPAVPCIHIMSREVHHAKTI